MAILQDNFNNDDESYVDSMDSTRQGQSPAESIAASDSSGPGESIATTQLNSTPAFDARVHSF